MKVIFFGTPDYVLPILKALVKKYEIVAVVTQPPKLTGRKKIKTYSPIDNWAHKRSIAVIYALDEVPKADLGVVAAYGKIIPKLVISNFKLGVLNIHPSLLPKYRGASPVQSAIMNGEEITGVTIIKMDEKMDHGPIISQFTEGIKAKDTTDSLRKRLFEKSTQFLITLIPNYLNGKIKPKLQDHSQATFTKILKKDDGYIAAERFTSEARKAERFIRAMHSWPGAWTLLRLSASEGQARRLKILKAHLEEGKLVLDEVQLEGKKPVSWQQFCQAYPEVSIS